MSFYKVPASWTTTSDAKLFTIKLGITQATSMDIEHIILITNILGYAKKVVNSSVYSEQAHFLAVCSTLRLFFSCSLNHRIKLWNCPSNTKCVIATTHQNGTCDMLTSAKLLVRYLVVRITRELDKEPSLY